MSGLVLYGSPTSPYVRRVRVVAIELGLDLPMVDTRDDEGQAKLRAVSPLWKVPVMVSNTSGPLFDSHAIIAAMLRAYGPGTLRIDETADVAASNLLHAIDGALDSLINVMYMGRDGITPAHSPYLRKQRERAAAAMSWVDDEWANRSAPLGLVEIALVSTLEWMKLRAAYDFSGHQNLVEAWKALADRPSFAQTRPQE